ncbi:hypothetical protein EVAR_319_1 [Eumeta japonica]|uniref:Uncharacterized protein n=1 Tax=Eumeta variegata TaxID=151549 RepID=A0A4C1SCT6_EUMVA|nr:hypothetical protein EVAR_319_1 [Eumeta japonica]
MVITSGMRIDDNVSNNLLSEAGGTSEPKIWPPKHIVDVNASPIRYWILNVFSATKIRQANKECCFEPKDTGFKVEPWTNWSLEKSILTASCLGEHVKSDRSRTSPPRRSIDEQPPPRTGPRTVEVPSLSKWKKKTVEATLQ